MASPLIHCGDTLWGVIVGLYNLMKSKAISTIMSISIGIFLGLYLKTHLDSNYITSAKFIISIIIICYILLLLYIHYYPPIKLRLIGEKILVASKEKPHIKIEVTNYTDDKIRVVGADAAMCAYFPTLVRSTPYKLKKMKTNLKIVGVDNALEPKDRKEIELQYFDEPPFETLWFKRVGISFSKGLKKYLIIRNIDHEIISHTRYIYEIVMYKIFGDRALVTD
jgi:hypothetical protein